MDDGEAYRKHLSLFCCPGCRSALVLDGGVFTCSSCGSTYPLSGNIPLLFVPNDWEATKKDVTNEVRSFYEDTPFPNYDDFDDVASLITKAREGFFPKMLDDQVPFGTVILECGCGTGQLSNFLSVASRTVFGSDISLSSLRLGQDFKERNGLERVFFLQMNLFRPCFREASFDLVIANGVLHHTADPFLAFRTLTTLVKPGGFILVGLYHKYGRLRTDFRRFLFRVTGDRFKSLDPRLRKKDLSPTRKETWFRDQYKNPHESKHTIGEVLRWLEETGFRFVKSIPKSRPFDSISAAERLFIPEKPGNRLERFVRERSMMFTGSREGGFFVVVARRPRRIDSVSPRK